MVTAEGSWDRLIFDNRLLWQTVSNAADKSTATQTSIGGLPLVESHCNVCCFEVLNCWLTLVASSLDEENEIPLKVIASFSALRFALPSIPLIVLHSLVRSVFWSMVSTKSLNFFPFVHTYTVLDVFIQSWQFR